MIELPDLLSHHSFGSTCSRRLSLPLFCLLLIPVLIIVITAGVSIATSRAATNSPTKLDTQSLPPACQQSLDPRLLLALSPSAPAPDALISISPGGFRSTTEPVFPVLIQSNLTDAALAALGLVFYNRNGDIISCRIPAADLLALAATPGISYIEAARPMIPVLDQSIPEIRADLVHNDSAGLTGSGVIIGLLDSGIDFTHADFLTNDGLTRVLSIWDQFLSGNPPAGQNYGTEFTQTDINEGLANLHLDRVGHGTHVASIAAGNGFSNPERTYCGVAPEADIIMVHNYYANMYNYGGGTPPYSAPTTVGSIDALNYLIRKAQALGKPLVVNQSQGMAMGPHDGSTLFDIAYTNLINENDLIICVAAGNWQNCKWHSREIVPPSGSHDFTLVVDSPPQAATTVEFECWGQQFDSFRWEISSPGGTAMSVPSSSGDINSWITAHSDSVCFWSTNSHPNNDECHLYGSIFNRTDGVEISEWQITAVAENNLPGGGIVDIYCERNQSQYHLLSDSNEYIIATPASVKEAITVGSYNTKLTWIDYIGNRQTVTDENPVGDISAFSSLGPCRDGHLKPDLSAPGQTIAAARATVSIPPSGAAEITPDGLHALYGGTSMAAPHVAGTIALLLEADPTLSPADIKMVLQTTATSDNFTGPLPNPRFGYGKLDAKAAVDAVARGICRTQAGDVNGDNQINVFDIVYTVNEILGAPADPLFSFACADINQDNTVSISDLVAIARLSLGLTINPTKTDLTPASVIWSQCQNDTDILFTFKGEDVAGLQLAFMLPGGYELSAEPTLTGVPSTVQIDCRARLSQYHLLAYDPFGASLSENNPMTLVIPISCLGYTDQDLTGFAITRTTFSDSFGRTMTSVQSDTLTADPGLPGNTVPLKPAQIKPNPFTLLSRIEYELPVSDHITVSIQDVTGRHIQTLFDGWQKGGNHTLVWDGHDRFSSPVPAGLYFIQFKTSNREHNTRIIVIR